MTETPKKRIGEILIESGLITQENLDEALAYQKQQGGLIGQIFIQLGYITEAQLVSALGHQLKVPYLPLNNYAVNMAAVQLLDESFCRKNIIVVFDTDDRRVFLAISDPLNSLAIEEVRQRTKLRPQVFISTSTEITNMLDLAFSRNLNNKTKKAG